MRREAKDVAGLKAEVEVLKARELISGSFLEAAELVCRSSNATQ